MPIKVTIYLLIISKLVGTLLPGRYLQIMLGNHYLGTQEVKTTQGYIETEMVAICCENDLKIQDS